MLVACQVVSKGGFSKCSSNNFHGTDPYRHTVMKANLIFSIILVGIFIIALLVILVTSGPKLESGVALSTRVLYLSYIVLISILLAGFVLIFHIDIITWLTLKDTIYYKIYIEDSAVLSRIESILKNNNIDYNLSGPRYIHGDRFLPKAFRFIFDTIIIQGVGIRIIILNSVGQETQKCTRIFLGPDNLISTGFFQTIRFEIESAFIDNLSHHI